MEVITPALTSGSEENQLGFYKCPVCHLCFESKIPLEEHHRNVHSKNNDGKLYFCSWKSEDGGDTCSKTFAIPSSVTRHVKTSHMKIPTKTYSCPWRSEDGIECGKTFKRKGKIRKHFDEAHFGRTALDDQFEPHDSASSSQTELHEVSKDSALMEEFACVKKNVDGEAGVRIFAHREDLKKHHQLHFRNKNLKENVEISSTQENEETCDLEEDLKTSPLSESDFEMYRPFECKWKDEDQETCVKKFVSREGLQAHLQRVHLKQPNQSNVLCIWETEGGNVCGSTFALKRNLRRHILEDHRKISTGGKNFVCHWTKENGKTCAKIFGRVDHAVKHHQVVHLKIRQHRCDWIFINGSVCNEKFKESGHLQAHIRDVHNKGDNLRKVFPCLFKTANGQACDRTFKRRAVLKRHLVEVHKERTSPPKIFACSWKTKNGDMCGKNFTRKASVKFHIIAVHMNIQPYNCAWKGKSEGETCTSQFPSNGHLQSHLRRVHFRAAGQSDGKYTCFWTEENGEACGNTFELLVSLRRHCEEVHRKNFDLPKLIREAVPVTDCSGQTETTTQSEQGCIEEEVHPELEHLEPRSRSRTTREEAELTIGATEQKRLDGATNFHRSPSDENQNFICDTRLNDDAVCGKEFKSQFRLLNHNWLSHDRGKPRLKCPLDVGACKREFHWINELRRHLKNSHTGQVQCPSCKCKFMSSESLINHDRIKHKGENLALGSENQNSTLPRQSSLAYKNRILGEVNFQTICDWKMADGVICGKVCESKLQLVRHKAVKHDRSRLKFPCDKCEAKFFLLTELKRHQSVHNGPRALGKDAIREAHEDQRAGEQVTDPATDLNRELLTDAPDISYTCLEQFEAGTFCLSSFESTTALEDHTKIIHRKQELATGSGNPGKPALAVASSPGEARGTIGRSRSSATDPSWNSAGGSAMESTKNSAYDIIGSCTHENARSSAGSSANRWFPVVALVRDDVDVWKRCNECHVFLETSRKLRRHQVETHSSALSVEASIRMVGNEDDNFNRMIQPREDPPTFGVQEVTAMDVSPSNPCEQISRAKHSLTFCGFCQKEFFTVTNIIHHLSTVHVEI